jgi:hypothetical protein
LYGHAFFPTIFRVRVPFYWKKCRPCSPVNILKTNTGNYNCH